MSETTTKSANENYSKAFSEEGFWNKLKKFAKKAGGQLVYAVLLLYYAFQAPNTPAWAKTIIIGALGYFISPLDAVPDLIVGVGYTDDLGAVGLALATVGMYINEDIKTKARAKLRDWFGDDILEDIQAVEDRLN